MKLRAHNTSGYDSGGDGGLGRVYGVSDGATLDIPMSPKWLYESACGKSDVDMTKSPSTLEQFEVCYSCPVYSECLEELIEIDPTEIVGTWAGHSNTTWKEFRKKIKSESSNS